jgi:hypothetical protein
MWGRSLFIETPRGVWDTRREILFDHRNPVDLYEPGPAGKYLGTYDFTAHDEYLKSRLMCLNRRDDGTADYTDRGPRGPQIQNTHPAYDVRPSTHPFTAEEKEAALGRLREKLGAPGGGRAALEKGWDPKAKASRRRSIRVEQRACQRLDCAEKLAAAESSRGDTEDEQQQQIQALTQEKGAEVAALELKLSSVEIQLKDTQKLLTIRLTMLTMLTMLTRARMRWKLRRHLTLMRRPTPMSSRRKLTWSLIKPVMLTNHQRPS